MTQRLSKMFIDAEAQKKSLLSIFLTAGFPQLNSTPSLCKALQDSGVDFLEIGIPFSDPLADGPVIQAASATALENGMTLEKTIEQVYEVRKNCDLPIFMMGYLNPVLQYGFERFLDEIKAAGADGVILPDLPVLEFERNYQKLFKERELSNVFLITPKTDEARIRKLDELSSGFLYLVSSPSITGTAMQADRDRDNYLQRVASYKLKNPLIVGFGISNYESFTSVTKETHGAIVGSAFIKALQELKMNSSESEINDCVSKFISFLRGVSV